MPCRNEAGHVGRALTSLLGEWREADAIEVIVADGASEDGTRAVVEGLRKRWSCIRVIANAKRTVPHGLNLALAEARGDVILRADAHAVYPAGYIAGLVSWLERSGADNVGCALETVAGADTMVARAIAFALSHAFGIGNSRFRLGTASVREVETVPFGCYRRDVFERIGKFDEALIRNQDDEFNYRLRRAGGKILLIPGMRVQYFARSTFRELWRMAFGYGLYKPLVLAKVRRVYAMRPLAPALLVLCLIARLRGPLLLYAGANLAVSVNAGKPMAAVAFAILHVGYGCGVLIGLFKLLRA